jgi:hypothetical protein
MSITTEPWFPGFVTGSLALIGVLIAALLQTFRERRKDRESIKTPAPPTTQQVWERLDRVERVLGSAVVVLGEVADQWQGEHPPVLSKRHMDVLASAGFIPPEWE